MKTSTSFGSTKTREDDDRELMMLRLRERGIDCGSIARRFGLLRSASVRTLFQRIDRDYAKSEASPISTLSTSDCVGNLLKEHV